MIKLEDGEQILYVARKHWLLFLSETVFLVLLAILPAAVLFVPAALSDRVFSALNIGDHLILLLIFFWSIWLMGLWAFFAMLWTDFYLDVWIVTNHRIIDIEQAGLFDRKVSSFRFEQVQDATVKVSGLLATLIGFGTVELRTASDESFKFKGVAQPNILKERIMSEHHRVHTD